jgi:hypothetical protein
VIISQIQAPEAHRFEFAPLEFCQTPESLFTRDNWVSQTELVSRAISERWYCGRGSEEDVTPVFRWKFGGRSMCFLCNCLRIGVSARVSVEPLAPNHEVVRIRIHLMRVTWRGGRVV